MTSMCERIKNRSKIFFDCRVHIFVHTRVFITFVSLHFYPTVCCDSFRRSPDLQVAWFAFVDEF